MNLHSHFLSVARTFVEARRKGEVVRSYPGPKPRNLVEAYAIQDYAIAFAGQPVAAWKVGRISDEFVSQFGDNRLAGPVFADAIRCQARPEMPILPGFSAIEAELIMRIARPIPAGVDLTSIPDHIDEVRLGLEIASSPFPEINAHGPAVTASDFGNNFGLVLGDRITNWRERDLLHAPTAMAIDGAVVGTGSAAEMLDGPFGAVAFVARLLAARGIPLAPGTWVSTGAITGVHPVKVGQLVSAQFDNDCAVTCRTTMYAPVAAQESK